MKRKDVFLLLLWCTLPFRFYGQEQAKITVDSCRNAFIKQIEVFPQGKIFVHTDRNVYAAGDTVWLKAYLVDAATLMPSAYSRFAYVDLISSEGNIIDRIKIKTAKNLSCGQIPLPQNLAEGNYALRAYTTAMYGLSHDFFFKKDIFIASKNKAEKIAKYAGDSGKNNFQTPLDNGQLNVEWGNDMLTVSVNQNDTLAKHLLVHTRGIAVYFEKWNPKIRILRFPKQDFPSGILEVALLGDNYTPLCQKLLLCENNDQAHLSFTAEQENNLLKIKFILTDNNNNPVAGNFSVSVTDNHFPVIDTTQNIHNYLLFSSDLKEKNAYDNKNFIFNENWKRYNLPQIITGKIDTLPNLIELGQTISGKVTNLSGKKGIAEAKVNIIAPQLMIGFTTTTDKNGNYIFNSLDFPENTEFAVQAYNKNGSSKVSLSVDEDNFPAVDAVDLPAKIDSSFAKNSYFYAFNDGIKTIELPEIEIKAQKKESTYHPFSAMADISFDSKKIEELHATCVHELLRRIAGVQVVGDNVIIRGASSIYGKSYAAIAVDGAILATMDEDGRRSSEFDLDVINMADVERVDVFKGGSSVIWGTLGKNGVISFTTKKGNFDYSKINELRYNTKNIKPLGYVLPSKFTQKTNNPLIYWNPNVNTYETGNTVIEFPAGKGAYSIVIQGITDEGLIIYKRATVGGYE